MEDESDRSRRRFLRITGGGSIIGLAGCLASGEEWENPTDRPDDWCYEDLEGPVPDVERNATSIDGLVRNDPDELQTKEDVAYKCGPEEGMQCGNCTFYISDKNGDAIGACTEVEGHVRSADWCGVWQPREKVGEED